MSEPFIGQILPMAYTFVPMGWALCDGSLLSIAQNPALYALVGTKFGGDGHQTFGTPNLNSSIIIGTGQGPGLTNHALGAAAGVGSVALGLSQMPPHTHQPMANTSANQLTPEGFIWGGDGMGVTATFNPNPPDVMLSQVSTLTPAGGTPGTGLAKPHSNIPPVLAFRYMVALEGIFPLNPN